MSKHTPGPWVVEDPMGAEIGLSIVQNGLKTYEWEFIAMVCQSTAGDERMGRQRFISPEEQEANARLISAAPDLLTKGKHLAVKLAEVYRAAGQSPKDCQAIREWMEAVAMAEGRS